jgi:hypothetical protein
VAGLGLWARRQNGLPLTNASVDKPLQPFDDYDEHSLIENCGIKEAKQQWDLDHPPQETERAVRVQVVFTLLMFSLATAYRLQCEREATGGEPVGWRRQILEQTRAKVMMCAQGAMTSFTSRSIPCCCGSGLRLSRQVSAHASKSWPNSDSQHAANCYVGTSVEDRAMEITN